MEWFATILVLTFVLLGNQTTSATEWRISGTPNRETFGRTNYSVNAIFIGAQNKNCAWSVSFPGFQSDIAFYSQFTVLTTDPMCQNQTVEGDFTLTCVEQQVNGTLRTELTILRSLPDGILRTAIFCGGILAAEKYVSVRNCSDENLPNGVTVTPKVQMYGGEALFSCSNGLRLYYSNGSVALAMTTQCLANGTWREQGNIRCQTGIQLLASPSGNMVATHFKNYTLTAVVPIPTRIFYYIIWEVSNSRGHTFQRVAFVRWEGTGLFPLRSVCTTKSDLLTATSCSRQHINGTLYVVTSLTLLQHLSAEDLFVRILATNGTYLNTVTVKNCSLEGLSNGVTVAPNSRGFGGEGEFSCSNGGRLFYSNGSALLGNRTQCLADATWRGQSNIRCLKDCSLEGLSNGVTITPKSRVFGGEGEFSCSNGGRLFYSNESALLGNRTQCLADATWRDQSDIRCLIDKPYQNHSETCVWHIDASGFCAVEFFSRSLTSFVALTRNGLNVENDGSNQPSRFSVKEQIFVFKRENVTVQDKGDYELILTSPSFEGNETIRFTVRVRTDDSSNVLHVAGVIVGITIAIVILIITKIFFVRYFIYGKQKIRKQQQNTSGEQFVASDTSVPDSTNERVAEIAHAGYIDIEGNTSSTIERHNTVLSDTTDFDGYEIYRTNVDVATAAGGYVEFAGMNSLAENAPNDSDKDSYFSMNGTLEKKSSNGIRGIPNVSHCDFRKSQYVDMMESEYENLRVVSNYEAEYENAQHETYENRRY